MTKEAVDAALDQWEAAIQEVAGKLVSFKGTMEAIQPHLTAAHKLRIMYIMIKFGEAMEVSDPVERLAKYMNGEEEGGDL